MKGGVQEVLSGFLKRENWRHFDCRTHYIIVFFFAWISYILEVTSSENVFIIIKNDKINEITLFCELERELLVFLVFYIICSLMQRSSSST